MENLKLICINTKPLSGNEVAPPLVEGETYELLNTIYDSKGNPHYDVGLESNYNYVKNKH